MKLYGSGPERGADVISTWPGSAFFPPPDPEESTDHSEVYDGLRQQADISSINEAMVSCQKATPHESLGMLKELHLYREGTT